MTFAYPGFRGVLGVKQVLCIALLMGAMNVWGVVEWFASVHCLGSYEAASLNTGPVFKVYKWNFLQYKAMLRRLRITSAGLLVCLMRATRSELAV